MIIYVIIIYLLGVIISAIICAIIDRKTYGDMNLNVCLLSIIFIVYMIIMGIALICYKLTSVIIEHYEQNKERLQEEQEVG